MSRLDQMDLEATLVVTNLGRLIARLALDEVLYRQFIDDPAAVTAGAGLSEEEERALQSEDWRQIKKHLGPRRRPLHEEEGHGGGGG